MGIRAGLCPETVAKDTSVWASSMRVFWPDRDCLASGSAVAEEHTAASGDDFRPMAGERPIIMEASIRSSFETRRE